MAAPPTVANTYDLAFRQISNTKLLHQQNAQEDTMIRSCLFSVLTVAIIIYLSLALQQAPLTAEKLPVTSHDPPLHDPDPAHITIDFSSPQAANNTTNILRTITNPHEKYPINLIHHITVTGDSTLGNWPLVTKLFSRATNLTTVHWHATKPISPRILHSLETHNPSCRLHYTLPFPPRGSLSLSTGLGLLDWFSNLWLEIQAWNSDQKSVIDSKNLYSLKVDITYSAEDNFYDMATVFDIVAAAPNLRELDLNLERWGCILAKTACSFNFRSHPFVRFPPLEVLRLRGYRFDDGAGGSWAWSWVELLALVGDVRPGEERIRRRETNLDTWMGRMDWGSLRTLEIGGLEEWVLDRLGGDKLPELRELVLCGGWRGGDRGRVAEFITETAKPLESLSLIDFDLKVEDEFMSDASFRRELKSFTLRPDHKNRSPIGNDMLHHLLTSSPKLESVDVTLKREDISWDEGLYRYFIASPTLRHLTLRFPSPDGPHLDYASLTGNDTDPLINNETTLELFKELRHRKQGSELESMHFYVGDWEARDAVTWMPSGNFRVAFYSCFIYEGEERCEGTQVRQR